jgi:hypothetical protein
MQKTALRMLRRRDTKNHQDENATKPFHAWRIVGSQQPLRVSRKYRRGCGPMATFGAYASGFVGGILMRRRQLAVVHNAAFVHGL